MEEPVLGWSPLLAPRYYQGLDYKHMSQSTGAGVLEPALEENDLCLSTSSALSQLTTDHQPKLRQNQMTSAVPVPRAHTVTPRAHPCTSAISYTTPHPMARLLPSVETAPEAASCLTPDRATPVQKPLHIFGQTFRQAIPSAAPVIPPGPKNCSLCASQTLAHSTCSINHRDTLVSPQSCWPVQLYT